MPLNVLVVGGGSIGERHLRCLQQLGCRMALCETSDERRAEVVARYGLDASFASVAEASAMHWDGVVVCTPAHLHADHAVVLAGCTSALLIEKPLGTQADDASRLSLALAGKVVQVAYVLRAHPATQQVRQWLAEGRIGAPHEVTALAGQHFPTFRPAYRTIYYARHQSGGGAIQDAATHLFDLVQHLAGPLDWVFCDAAHQHLPGVEVEDTVHVVGRAGGAMISIALNQFMAPNETHVQLNGSQGSLAIRFHEQRAGIFLHGDADWTWTEPLVRERDDLFRAQGQWFLSAATGAKPPLCSLAEGAAALRVNLAALESVRLGKRVTIASSGQTG